MGQLCAMELGGNKTFRQLLQDKDLARLPLAQKYSDPVVAERSAILQARAKQAAAADAAVAAKAATQTVRGACRTQASAVTPEVAGTMNSRNGAVVSNNCAPTTPVAIAPR